MPDRELSVIFDRMAQTAKDALAEVEKQEYTQAIVVLTSNGNEHCSVIQNALSAEMTEEKRLLDMLEQRIDTCVRYVLCMWYNGAIDLPSYRFREMLLHIDPDNRNADIFVMTNDGYSLRKISSSIKS